MKRSILFILVATALSLSKCVADDGLTLTHSSQVVNILSSIKSWAESDSHTEADWNYLLEVAHVIKQSDPQIVQEGLADFIRMNNATNADYFNQTKPYLLMRILFDLPTNAPEADDFSFANFITFGREKNSDGTVNLSWPVCWKQGKPFFCSRCLGAEGPPPYRADEEYNYMCKHFKYRPLNSAK